MNKYKAITKESKKLRNEGIKSQLKILSPSVVLDKEKVSKQILHTQEICVILAAYQIILDRDIYNMDEEKLNEVLNKMKIDKDHFIEQINRYDNYSYIAIAKYLRLASIINDPNKLEEEKYEFAMKASHDASLDAKTMKAYVTLNKEDYMDNDMVRKIDDLVDSIYEDTIKSKVTDEELKESDLIKSAYDKKK